MGLHTSIYTPSLQVHNTSESDSDSAHTALAPPPTVPQDSPSTPQFSPPSVPSASLPGSPMMSETFDARLTHLEQASQSQIRFQDDIAKIMWHYPTSRQVVLPPTARASLTMNTFYGSSHFNTWEEFKKEFIREFMPEDERTQASLTLEGASYFQGTTSVDEYVDNFRALITMAGLNIKPILYSTNPTNPAIKA
ncbi:hypothetical protein D9758_015693 [Tetrapyrgos nigripes]|uniref:Retrotransposon gag domain-containing protein n=1 Tax=Tetrapyrgos nigripes TaxID=182062 RepID=A0A8H5C7N5_9AGAR|nr:hypothetical protein D9758_015693 [Tetrapyrgos nigripes]